MSEAVRLGVVMDNRLYWLFVGRQRGKASPSSTEHSWLHETSESIIPNRIKIKNGK
jgi:hypothetical protein